MNYFSLLLCLLLFSVSTLTAQQPKDRIRLDGNPINNPLVMVDSFHTDINYLIIDAKDIALIDVLKDNRAIERYGEKGKNGVLFIHPKKEVTLLRLPALLEAFAFPVVQRNLRVCINEVIVRSPELLLADPLEIESIRTVALPVTEGLRTREELFINIVRKKKDR